MYACSAFQDATGVGHENIEYHIQKDRCMEHKYNNTKLFKVLLVYYIKHCIILTVMENNCNGT